jgi:hypothetical protein
VSFFADDIKWREPRTNEHDKLLSERPVLTSSLPVEISEDGGTVRLRPAPQPDKQIAGVIFEGSRDRPVAGHSVQLTRYPEGGPMPLPFESFVSEHLKTTAKGEFVQLDTEPRRGLFGLMTKSALRLPWHTADGREAEFLWPYGLLKNYQLTGSGTFYEVDLARLGTVRISFTGMDELLATGYTPPEPLSIGFGFYRSAASRPSSRGSPRMAGPETAVEALGRRIDVLNTRSLDLLMLEGDEGTKHHMNLQFVTARPKEDAPDLIAHTTQTRSLSFEVTAGQVTEVPVALDELDKWDASSPQWHRVAPPTSQPQSAAH